MSSRQHSEGKTFRTRLRAAVTVVVAAAAVLVPAAQPANAVTPAAVVTALRTAYDVYNKLFNHQLTTAEATTQIITAVNSAKAELLAHIDQVEAGHVSACARAAVIDLADVNRLTHDQAQAFARDATACVTLGEADIRALTGRSLDEVGFAVNTVGPIALFARLFSGLTTPELTTTLINANTNLVARLKPSCVDHWLWPDATPQFVEVELICTAYNGNQGYDAIIWKRTKPNPPLNYTNAIANAMVGTSHPVGLDALARLH